MDTAMISQIIDAFGETFVKYTLNADTEDLEQLDWTDARAQAMESLNPFATAVRSASSAFEKEEIRSRVVGSLSINASVVENHGFATQLRISCGGVVYEAHSDAESMDDVAKLLERCVREAHPLLYLPAESAPSHGLSHFRGSSAVLFHLLPARLLAIALLKDQALRGLFYEPSDLESLIPEDFGRLNTIGTKPLTMLTGSRASTQLPMVVANLVDYGLVIGGLNEVPTAARCIDAAMHGLAEARSLARGEQTRTALLVGIGNVQLAPDVPEVRLGNDTIRRATRLALKAVGNLGGQIKTILESSTREHILSTDSAEPFESFNAKFERAQLDQQHELRSRLFSLLLASGSELVAGTAEVIMPLHPIQGLTSWQIDEIRLRPFPQTVISSAVAKSISEWDARVRTLPESLRIAMRRLLSATTLRGDAMDGFIDAVMSWENLFGGSQDTTLKVCGSLAVLLEPDTAARRDLFRELTRLYEARSQLVHGATEPDIRTAHRHRDRAVEIGIEAMRKVLVTPEILALSDSVKRNKWMLLGIAS